MFQYQTSLSTLFPRVLFLFLYCFHFILLALEMLKGYSHCFVPSSLVAYNMFHLPLSVSSPYSIFILFVSFFLTLLFSSFGTTSPSSHCYILCLFSLYYFFFSFHALLFPLFLHRLFFIRCHRCHLTSQIRLCLDILPCPLLSHEPLPFFNSCPLGTVLSVLFLAVSFLPPSLRYSSDSASLWPLSLIDFATSTPDTIKFYHSSNNVES